MHWTCDISGNVSAGCVGDNDAWSGVVSHPDAIPVTTYRGRRLTMPNVQQGILNNPSKNVYR